MFARLGGAKAAMFIGAMNQAAFQWGAAIGASLAGAICDLRTTRIPNWLTGPAAGAGLIYAACSGGLSGLGDSAAACLLVPLPYVVLFVLGQGGAGDAKLMGALGAWLGIADGLIVLCSVAIVGGAFALLRILAHPRRRMVCSNLVASLYLYGIALMSGRKGLAIIRTEPQEQADFDGRQVTIPYGVAIFVGVCLAALMVHLWMT